MPKIYLNQTLNAWMCTSSCTLRSLVSVGAPGLLLSRGCRGSCQVLFVKSKGGNHSSPGKSEAQPDLRTVWEKGPQRGWAQTTPGAPTLGVAGSPGNVDAEPRWLPHFLTSADVGPRPPGGKRQNAFGTTPAAARTVVTVPRGLRENWGAGHGKVKGDGGQTVLSPKSCSIPRLVWLGRIWLYKNKSFLRVKSQSKVRKEGRCRFTGSIADARGSSAALGLSRKTELGSILEVVLSS